MDVTFQAPTGWEHVVVVASIDTKPSSIRNVRGLRLHPGEVREIPAGSLIMLQAAGSRYWPGVIQLHQVTWDGDLVPVLDQSGVVSAAGPGRLRNIAPRITRVLDELRGAHPSDQERAVIDALRALDGGRRRLIVQMAHGDGWALAGDPDAGAAEFDPEQDA